jgi:ketosteroid isomerase-like protein
MTKVGNDMTDHQTALFTGTEQDRKDILSKHQAYLDANYELDREWLKKIWSNHPSCVFFNGNGHTYYGLEHWLKLWKFYKTQFKTDEGWKSTDVRLIGDSDLAVVTCHRTAKLSWIGGSEAAPFSGKTWYSKTTEVFRKENGQWKCVHIHVSTDNQDPRPAGI